MYAEGQPDTIVEDIENMVRSFVDKVMGNFGFIFQIVGIFIEGIL